jgi:hypothetical protein
MLGDSACNICGPDGHGEAAAIWSAMTTGVAIGVPGAPLLRFGTIPGEPFSKLQTTLMNGLTPAPLLLGYTNGYFGYFPDQASVTFNAGAYGVASCAGGNASGPVYFQSSGSSPTNGDLMAADLRSMIVNDLQ